MSAYADSVSRKSSIQEIVEHEDFGDNVSIIKRAEASPVQTIILKVFLGLLFIGFVTGCIIYSVINSESEHNNEHVNVTTYFLWDISQHCTDGTLTVTNRTGNINDYDTVGTGISWLQDSTRQRIFHRIGTAENDSDWQSTYFVFSNHSFVVTKQGCTRQLIGYKEFLRQLGLFNIRKVRQEAFKIEQKYVEVNYFEGEPALDIVLDGLHPTLVRAYSSLNNAVDYGWEYIFPQSANGIGIFRKEYWFPTMAAGDTDYSIFENIPDICYETKNQPTTIQPVPVASTKKK